MGRFFYYNDMNNTTIQEAYEYAEQVNEWHVWEALIRRDDFETLDIEYILKIAQYIARRST